MELHRCRFVPYNPQAINALEFSHPASSKATGQGAQTLRLAVGRANGDIEIWNPLRGAWFQETIIRGGKGRCIEGLAWTLDPSEDAADGSGLKVPGRLRLFSIGYTNTVTEWDLEKGRPARHSSGSYGEIWCLTAQPRWTSTNTGKSAEGEYTSQHLAIGCADGSIVILSTADNDLKFVRRLQVSVTKNVRVLSIAFQNRNVIAAGYADSSIRLFDIRNGRLLRTVSLGRGPVGGPKDILVWSVKCLSDGTLVSGDSTGEIRFWDAKNYSLIQRLRGHQADVLDVAVGVDGESVISGGADRRTVLYRLKPGKKNDKSRRWAEVMHRRYHTHDVKKFAVYESKDISIAVSGGPDATLVVMPLRESGKEHHRTLSSLPQICQLASGSSSRLMMSFWEREARIWRIAPEIGEDADESQRNQLVGRVLIPGDENITSAALSSDGTLLVLSTMTTVRMFTLSGNDSEDEDGVLDIKDMNLPLQIADDGARVVSLSPDLQWLSIIRPSNEIYLAKLSTGDTPDNQTQASSKLLRLERSSSGKTRTLRGVNVGTLGDYDRTIRTVTFSADSKLFAVGDLAGYVDFWALEDVSPEQQPQPRTNGASTSNHEFDESDDDDDDDDDNNSMQTIDNQRWKSLAAMPCMHAGIVFISFRPTTTTTSTSSSTDDRLLVLTSRHQLTEYEALHGKFSDWSQKNPKSHLPEEFIGLKDRAIGGVCGLFGPAQMPKLLLYGPSWMWMFDLTHDFPSPTTTTTTNNSHHHHHHSNNTTTAGLQKRKRLLSEEDEQERRKYNSGAGDLIPTSQARVTLGTKWRKINSTSTSTSNNNGAKHENEDEEEEEVIINAEKHRQHGHKNTNNKHDNGEDVADEDEQEEDEDDNAYPNKNPFFVNGEPDFAHLRRGEDNKDKDKPSTTTPIFWHSYRFRDILGVLPLGSDYKNSSFNHNNTKGNGALVELAVVERPLWDMDLGERYVKDYE